jgi:hypothetical protein
MNLGRAARVRLAVLPVIAAGALLSLHVFGLGWVASAAVAMAAVVVGLALAASLLAPATRLGAAGGPEVDKPRASEGDGIQSREWHAAVKLIKASRRQTWLARRGIAGQMSCTDVDFRALKRYVLILLQETLRGARAGYPSDAELIAAASGIYPEWSRVVRQDEETLRNTLLMAWGYEESRGPVATRESIPYMAAAISALSRETDADVSTQRALVARRFKENVQILREKYGNDWES